MDNIPKILQRESINKRLQNILSFPLTIVTAPMGYGKTTAVREFLCQNRVRCRWLSLGEASADCGYFWHHLTRQISESCQNLGNDLQALGFPEDSVQRARVVEQLLNMSFHEAYCLVMDDYHKAENDRLNCLLETIARSEITNLHLVIISRHLPKMNLTELIVKNLAVFVDIDCFRFSDEDTLRYFALMGYPLKKTDIPYIQDIAGGWISALYLIYRGLKDGIPLKNITDVQDLIKTGIYELYDEKTKTALCALAVLGTFTMDLAEQATGIVSISATIEQLYGENAFIELDKSAGVYTIHNVFRRFLKHEARRHGLETKEIYRRAGEWYLERQDYTQAFRYLLQGEAYETLLEVLEKLAFYADANTRAVLLRYFDVIPQQTKDRHPIAYLKLILLFVIAGNKEKGLEILKQFEKGDFPKEPCPEHALEIEIGITWLKMFLAFNDAELMISYAKIAYEQLNGRISNIAGHKGQFSYGSPHFTFIYYKDVGAYKKTSELPFEKYAMQLGSVSMGSEALSLAEYALETGNFDAVEGYAVKAIYRAGTKNNIPLVICASLTLARLYLVQNKYAEALQLLDSLSGEIASNIDSILLDSHDLCMGYFFATTGELKKIPRWISEGAVKDNALLFQGLVFSYVVYGKVLILSGDWLKSEALCETFSPYFEVFNNQLGYIHNYIHLAIAVNKQGESGKAKEYLNEALLIGQADNIVLPFMENSDNLLPLLKLINRKGSLGMDYIHRLVELCTFYAPIFTGQWGAKKLLSARETEVLRLMAKGFSRKDIAEKLFLSTGTVRTHIQNIYHKLGVNKKNDALRKAMELDIL